MGAYLSQPNTTKTSSDGGNGNISYGFSAMQGWRVSMEVRRKMNETTLWPLSFLRCKCALSYKRRDKRGYENGLCIGLFVLGCMVTFQGLSHK